MIAYETPDLETYTGYIRRARRHQGGSTGHRTGTGLDRKSPGCGPIFGNGENEQC